MPFPDGSFDKPGNCFLLDRSVYFIPNHNVLSFFWILCFVLKCAYCWRPAVSYSVPKLVILDMNMALHIYEDIMRMTDNLNEKYIIGHGASSTVYKCVLKNCKPVAIKRLYSHHPQCLKEFETELETLGSIKHRNLVSLQGYSISPSGNLLFYDYMENGSLWDLLHGMHFAKYIYCMEMNIYSV